LDCSPGFTAGPDLKRKKSIIIPGDGDPCPRCGKPMQIRAYGDVVDEQLRAAFSYTRWFCCMKT
jgi:hypothetical protein